MNFRGEEMKKRGFEIVAKYADAGLNLPQRQTKQAAGYDFEAAADFVVPSIWKQGLFKALHAIKHAAKPGEEELTAGDQALKPVLVPTESRPTCSQMRC